MTKNDFSNILLSAIDEGLSSLGQSSKQAIFYHLEASFHIKREGIPTNLTYFRKALEEIFGHGTQYVEKAIAIRLHEKLGLDFEKNERTNLLTCVNIAKKLVKPKKDRAAE